ncbi:MAG: PQQ-binding-like beta-propeller repeat protein [Novosphingobium sp.]|nr:PQQ-binding-like beta-propeller repeat protein [Novosphingobium sp.]MBO9601591.1 PQQ-binding-like beta-propeller repeat protein [Novosphingobium sp.]
MAATAAGGIAAATFGLVTLAAAQDASAGSAAQVSSGKELYLQNCAVCHGKNLTDGQFAPALQGPAFLAKWQGPSAARLDRYIRSSMPPSAAGALPAETYSAIVAFLLQANGAEIGNEALGNDPARLDKIVLPKPPADTLTEYGVGGASPDRALPKWPTPPERFTDYTPVTQAMLDNPAPGDWLTWRRSHAGQGFSPLSQITTGNVGKLQLVWSQPLPAGETMIEPLVRDGVLYAFGYGDQIMAFDAASGRLLWRYRRSLPKGTQLSSKKTVALFGDKLYAATSDLHMIALDARTGQQVWDTEITDKPGFRNPGGPMVADGVVMQGLTTQEAGGGLIAGFDAETGERLWTFDTVAKPGTPGGETWNGIPGPDRKGGSVWTSGTYDAKTGLALWGTAQSYDTLPLRDRKPGLNNDALYTDTTLALEPRTGKLAWYFQHMKDDQFDLDWVFERVIGQMKVGGLERRVIMTSGKEGLFDVLDADSGKYIKTIDLGIQNFVTKIDPVTGDKTVDPALIPDNTRTRYVCPHAGGGRNWLPTAFNQGTGLLFVTVRDVCMDMVPSARAMLTTGVGIYYAPPPNSDGRYGLLAALDMQTGEVRWRQHQRAQYNMGVLATAGGLLFTGSVDRRFSAYDQATGKLLWQQVTTGIPNASAISYSVDGKQYIAMVTGNGNPTSAGLGDLTPEIELPPVNTAAVSVFALPN